MNAKRFGHRRMRRILPLLIACCLGAFSSQPVSEVRFRSTCGACSKVRQADTGWSRAASQDRSLLVIW
jgi:hypothetical protein